MQPRQKRIVIIRPVMNETYYPYPRAFYEVMTSCIGAFVKREALMKGFEIVDLAGQDADRKKVEEALKLKPDIVLFLGHGHADGDRAIGQKKKALLKESNIEKCSGAQLYFVACHVAKKLGKLAVSRKAAFFIGFDDRFLLVPGELEPIVSGCVASGIIELVRGGCPVQAWMQMQLEHIRWIKELEAEQIKYGNNWFIASAVLRSNMLHAKLILE